MVDTVNLLLFENTAEMLVQFLGRLKACSERLLHNHAAPSVFRISHIHAVFLKILGYQFVHQRRSGQVIDNPVRNILLLLQRMDTVFQFYIFGGVGWIECQVEQNSEEFIQFCAVCFLISPCFQDVFTLFGTELFVRVSRTGRTQYSEMFG